MSFDARIVFTGVCSFIFNQDTARNVRACVVLPEAEGRGVFEILNQKSPDTLNLRRHRAFIRFSLLNLDAIPDKTGLTEDAEALLYVEGKRITFNFKEGDQGKVDNAFKVDPALWKNLVNLEEVAPNHADQFADVVSAKPPAGTLTSQVLLHRGTVKNELTATAMATWVLPSHLSGKVPPLTKTLTPEVSVALSDLNGFQIKATPFDGSTPDVLNLSAPTGKTLRVTISHLCSENPLRWISKDIEAKDDVDFKWHYMLLSPANRQDLELRVLNGLPLPMPLRPFDGTGGQGVDCPPAIGKDRTFNLDSFI